MVNLNEQLRKIREKIEEYQTKINEGKKLKREITDSIRSWREIIRDLKDERRTLIFKSVGVEIAKDEE